LADNGHAKADDCFACGDGADDAGGGGAEESDDDRADRFEELDDDGANDRFDRGDKADELDGDGADRSNCGDEADDVDDG